MQPSERLSDPSSNEPLTLTSPIPSLAKSTDLSVAFELALELCDRPIFIVAREGLKFLWANSAGMRFLGIAKDELSRYVLADFVPHSVLHEFWQAFDQHDGSLPNGSSTSLISATGDSHHVCWAVAGDTLVVRGLAAADTLAVADAVTGLPDRRAFRERVERAIREQRSNWGVLFVDLNDFKLINDRWGHVIGDRMLADFAHQLRTHSRPQDLVVRFGGDEFLIFTDQVRSEVELRAIAQRMMREVFGKANCDDGETAKVGCSIGVAMGGPACQLEKMISTADRDMYSQKLNKRQ